MMDEAKRFVSVDEERLEELEGKAKDYDWKCGYVRGIEDGIAYATELLQALGQTERSE